MIDNFSECVRGAGGTASGDAPGDQGSGTSFTDGDMYRGTPEEYASAGTSYLAYSGPYRVDEVRRTVEHGMAISLFPNWAGERQLRVVEIEGDELRLRTEQPSMFDGGLKDALVTWRRAPSSS